MHAKTIDHVGSTFMQIDDIARQGILVNQNQGALAYPSHQVRIVQDMVDLWVPLEVKEKIIITFMFF